MKNLPVTAIIPTYNREALCLRALQSIYSQTAIPSQVIVVDDGSESPITAVTELLSQHGGMYLRQENLGVSAARNLGVKYASQEWVAFLDSDDTWLPQKLEKQFQLHIDDAKLAISQTEEIWMRNQVPVKQRAHQFAARGECFQRSLELCSISASAVLIRKDIFLDQGGFDTAFPVCEDYDLWLRLTRFYQVGLVEEGLVVKYRGGDDQLSESVPVPDQFRVRALIKLLTLELTVRQRELTLCVLEKRLSILEKGARKRGLDADLLEYQQIRRHYLA